MINVIITLIIIGIVGAASTYIVRSKKRGVKCIGCPLSGQCCSAEKATDSQDAGCGGCCGCGDK